MAASCPWGKTKGISHGNNLTGAVKNSLTVAVKNNLIRAVKNSLGQ